MSKHRAAFSRRRFTFWVGLGLFSVGEKFGVAGFDRLAAAAMRTADTAPQAIPALTPEHWTAADNNTWRWFERENLVDGSWKLTGITLPVHKETGEPYAVKTGYIDEGLVPEAVRSGKPIDPGPKQEAFEADHGKPSPTRRARHGRPPSRWLRSLNADELRIWLPKIDVPEAGVSGMTFWEHLTRDHSFDSKRLEGLTEDEQAKLHAAAHYGY